MAEEKCLGAEVSVNLAVEGRACPAARSSSPSQQEGEGWAQVVGPEGARQPHEARRPRVGGGT